MYSSVILISIFFSVRIIYSYTDASSWNTFMQLTNKMRYEQISQKHRSFSPPIVSVHCSYNPKLQYSAYTHIDFDLVWLIM